jgi:hypothetical protein
MRKTISLKTLMLTENCAVLFFIMEYLVRFICSPRKWRFFKQPMNLVDFCAIIPFILDLVIGGLQVPAKPFFLFDQSES